MQPDASADWSAQAATNPAFLFDQPSPPTQSLVIKIPSMAPNTRSSARHRSVSNASGSEYHDSNVSVEADDDLPLPEEQPEEPQVEYSLSSRGRKIARKSYVESSEDDRHHDLPPSPAKQENGIQDGFIEEDEDDEDQPRYPLRTRAKKTGKGKLNGFIVSDDEGGAGIGRHKTRSRSKNGVLPPTRNRNETGGRLTRRPGSQLQTSGSRSTRSRNGIRRTRQPERVPHDEEGYVDEPSSGSIDADGSFDDVLPTSPEPEPEPGDDADADGELDADGEIEQEPETDGRPYALRQRVKINYAIPPPIEEMKAPPKPRSGGGRSNGRSGGLGRSKAPGWSASGAELSKWMGVPGDDSDSDYPTRTPRKPFAANGMDEVFGGGRNTGGLFPNDLAAAAGTPSNLGKVGDASLADADPLGVNQNVTFDEVGGLDDHINSLKEMTLLPLLYPEVFQRFNLTPPRGVLFHGPPGTGKTLLARALAASCRADGRSISFFMRKGADCLSKWVGEAERQLRLLFEEARNQQPSIIFFDEIDGLAPVRSSKQDQIHASIVSTLLALMDGMDGRGQVIVIGATNRPDAIDPALRRPGRFDREFYFPLPKLDARERILGIMTKKWAGWDGDKGAENVKGLAKFTKGYGGADLRALCTEAALNAVQRRYPQIYKSSERLLLQPESIEVELRDFMIAIKKLVPSSARSVSSAASPLPSQLVPLLQESLNRITDVVGKVLPISKQRTALEEAEWEDEGGDNALERELMLQSMETLRVYRPRVVLHGPEGMGQNYVAAAVLHHLEGYHIQNLDLGSLMGDSTRTPEAAIVQLFVEAKRHQPSVIYIPSLLGWCAAVSETSRTTVRAMLETLAPTDPILLLAVVDGPFNALPRDVRAWFGPTKDHRVELKSPVSSQREQFFEGLIQDVQRPPNQFPDGNKRKKRVLEELSKAPPLEPRQPTAAELAVQAENDRRVVTLIRYRLGPILQELKRKFKRFTKRAMEEYNYDFDAVRTVKEVEVVTTSVEVRTNADSVVEITQERPTEEMVDQQPVNGVNGVHGPESAPQAPPQVPLFDMDLERMHLDLYRNRYLTPDDFLDDIRKIVHNAQVRIHEDPERMYRAQAMLTAAEVSINEFDPTFKLECQRMAARERQRREEYRKSKDKGKAPEGAPNGSGYAPGTRRSARQNGQQLDITLTDPQQLERKLKRQRSTSAAATPSEDGGERGQKRSRVASEDHDPLDIISHPQTPERHGNVRFAELVETSTSADQPANQMSVDLAPLSDPPRRSGFDPSLLNPMPSPIHERQAAVAMDVNHNPFLSYPLPQSLEAPSIVDRPEGYLPVQSQQLDPQVPQAVQSSILAPDQAVPNGTTEMDTAPIVNVDVPMEVERPATPLPDFYLDELLLSDLKRVLRDDTHALNIEQLEQLRATCLGCVWRHRAEWDRTECIRELIDGAREFVEEVSLDAVDAPSPA